MKKNNYTLLTFILLFIVITVQAQRFSGTIENHDKGEMDIVLTMFGFDKLVKIGTLQAAGNFEIDLTTDPLVTLTNEDRAFYIDKLAYGFQYSCANPDDFPKGKPKIARDAGYIALWQSDTWAGTLFPVSNEKLQLWMDDSGYNDAEEGSFYKVLLVTEAVELQKKCTNSDFYDEKDIEIAIEFDIRLNKGLNLVKYQLETIYKTDPNIRASFPTKVKITDSNENQQIIWKAKYFY